MTLSARGSNKKLLFTLLDFFFIGATAKTVYTVIYLKQKGISNTTIGLIFSINALVSIVGQPMWGFISDWTKSPKGVLLFCFGSGTLIYSLLLFTNSPLLAGLILVFDNFFECAISSILDVWIISSSIGKSYSSIRLWGSLGYSLIVLLFGQVIGSRSVSFMFPFYIGISAIGFVICLFTNIEENVPAAAVKLNFFSTGSLIKNYKYIVLIIFVFLLFLGVTPAGTFLPNLFKMTGGTTKQFGIMNSVRAFAEIPTFFFGTYLLKKYGPVKLISFCAGLYMIVQFLFAAAASPLQIGIGQVLQGPAYSLFLIGTLNYVYELSPSDLKSTAQTLMNGLGRGMSAIVGNCFGGILTDRYSLRMMYWTGSFSVVLAIVFFALSLLLMKILPDRRHRTIEQ